MCYGKEKKISRETFRNTQLNRNIRTQLYPLYPTKNTQPIQRSESYKTRHEKNIYGSQFLELCKQGNELSCLNYLQGLNKLYLDYTYNNNTPLTYALHNKMEMLCMQLLSYPNCGLNHIDSDGNTMLMLACKAKMEKVCLEILKQSQSSYVYNNMNYLSIQNNHGSTALILACLYDLEYVCAEILSYPKYCGLDKCDSDGYTALMCACESNMDAISIMILHYPNQCGINRVSKKGINAYSMAKFHRMEIVCHKIRSQSVLREMYG